MEEGITIPFLEGILKDKIDFLKIGPGSNLGDNYTSIMHSIEFNFQKDPLTPIYLVLKAYPNHPARQKFLEDSELFRKELLVYNSLIPDLVTFANNRLTSIRDQQEMKLAFPPLVGGRAVKNTNDLPLPQLANYLLMVDIRKTWGYKMANRFEGLDFAHCRLLMKELAKFHALNWCYKVEKSGVTPGHAEVKSLKDLYPFLKESVFRADEAELTELLMGQGFGVMGSLLEDKLGADSEICAGFQRLKLNAAQSLLLYLHDEDDIPEDAVASLLRIKPNPDPDSSSPWKVVCHGDCWSNNMLFLYEDDTPEAKPSKIMLVDLQLCREACPTTDLAYFFYSSTTSDLRQGHLDTLLELYATHFMDYCTLLGGSPLPGFSCTELKRRFHRTKPFGLLVATMIIPLILRAPEALEDLDKLESKGNGENLQDLLTTIQQKPSDTELISKRIVSMAQELYEQGVI